MNRPRRGVVFHKMHSLGNDFMVIERVTQQVQLEPEQIAAWGDRRTGIGFDQLLIIDPPTQNDADFCYGIYNADGTSAEQCGNGTRCVAMLSRQLELTKKETLQWQSPAGRLETRFFSPQQIETTMTVPVLNPTEIPFASGHAEGSDTLAEGVRVWHLESNGASYPLTPVSMGNPHGVMFLDNIFDVDVDGIGSSLTRHPAFPEGANIGFCQVIDQQFVRLRVYERGVGETQACGSGACAAVVAARLHGLVGNRVKVSLPGGKLRIAWPEPGAAVTMAGAASLVYRGELPGGGN